MKPFTSICALTLAAALTFPTLTAVAQEGANPPPPPAGEAEARPHHDGEGKPQHPRRRHHRGGGGQGGRFFGDIGQRLDFTDEQKKGIRDLLNTSRPTLEPLLKSAHQERKALATVSETTPVDEAAIRAQAAKLAALEADLAVQKAHLFSKIQALLTPEQVSKLKDLEGASERLLRGALSRIERQGRRPDGERRGPRKEKKGPREGQKEEAKEPTTEQAAPNAL